MCHVSMEWPPAGTTGEKKSSSQCSNAHCDDIIQHVLTGEALCGIPVLVFGNTFVVKLESGMLG